MADRKYRVLVAKTEGGLHVAAGSDWKMLGNTIREFQQLKTNDDHSLGNIGAIEVSEPGWVALAYRDTN